MSHSDPSPRADLPPRAAEIVLLRHLAHRFSSALTPDVNTVVFSRVKEDWREVAVTLDALAAELEKPTPPALPPRAELDPTDEMLASPEFEAVWQAIKGWDIQRAPGRGYAGATGTDVRTILDALTASRPAALPPRAEWVKLLRRLVHMARQRAALQPTLLWGEGAMVPVYVTSLDADTLDAIAAHLVASPDEHWSDGYLAGFKAGNRYLAMRMASPPGSEEKP